MTLVLNTILIASDVQSGTALCEKNALGYDLGTELKGIDITAAIVSTFANEDGFNFGLLESGIDCNENGFVYECSFDMKMHIYYL